MTAPKGPTVAVLPVAENETTAACPEILQPGGWPAPKGYANGMAADGRLVVTGGVIGWDHQGDLPAEFTAHYRQEIAKFTQVIADAKIPKQ